MNRASPLSIREMEKYVADNGEKLLSMPNVTSVGVGYNEVNGSVTDELSIQVTVEEKFSLEALTDQNVEPLPKMVSIRGVEVPVDVLQGKYEVALLAHVEIEQRMRTAVVNPIHPGVSIAHRALTAGTVGAVVYDKTDGTPYLLSNWHVMQGAHGKIGDAIVQPGPLDQPVMEQNVIGQLVRSYLGDRGDAAICSVNDRIVDPVVLGFTKAVARTGRPTVRTHVAKSGRTTGLTYGVVKRTGILASIDYGFPTPVIVRCFEVGPDPDRPTQGEISRSGDSGSSYLRVRRGCITDVMVGLHFAGETSGRDRALVCYADDVFGALGVVATRPE